jgi:hypothetical protein
VVLSSGFGIQRLLQSSASFQYSIVRKLTFNAVERLPICVPVPLVSSRRAPQSDS